MTLAAPSPGGKLWQRPCYRALGHRNGDFVGDALAEHGLNGRLLPGRERDGFQAQGGGPGLRFGKGCLHLGIDKRLG